jgi:drug/metabolite transporter (DMT)-like permease
MPPAAARPRGDILADASKWSAAMTETCPLPTRPDRRGIHLPTEIALLVMLSVLWGASFTLIKVAVETIPPATVVAIRVALAAAILVAVARWQGQAMPDDRAAWRDYFVQGLLQSALPFTLISWGEVAIASGLAGVLNATPPIFVFLITWLTTRHDPPDRQKILGVAVGFIGVVAIIGPDALRGIAGAPLAQLAILGASLSYALAALWARRLRESPAVVTAAGTMICAAAVMAPLALVWDRPWTLAPSARSVAAALALAVLSTTLAMIIFFRLLRTLGALATTSGSYLRAGASVILGMLFLGEDLDASSVLGMALIVLGVAAVNGQLWRRRRGNRTRGLP